MEGQLEDDCNITRLYILAFNERKLKNWAELDRLYDIQETGEFKTGELVPRIKTLLEMHEFHRV